MHVSVLLNESIENLNIKEDGIYVDCTLGFAGHSKEILKRIKKGKLFAFDQDGEAINYSKKILDQISGNYEIIKSNFAFIKSELNKRGIEKVDGVLFDLGVSSVQLDEAERGFSFHKDAKLDMRMDTDQSFSAYDVVNDYSKEELETIFFKYGEEKYSRSIASAIVRARENRKIETTLELTEIIRESVPEKYRRTHHPARKAFQAIRIEVNKELDVFTKALNDAIDMLNPGGRICVITFHSLEDRICKNIFKEKSEIDGRFKNVVCYQGDILFYQLSNLPSQKGELCNPNGDYLLYGENVKSNKVVYRYENYGKNEKAEYRGSIAELETSDFITGRLNGSLWLKNIYMDTLFVFNKEKCDFSPEYIFDVGDNPWDYKTFVHLYYLDKDYLNTYNSKTLLQEFFLGEKHLIYKMKKGKDEAVGVYSILDNKNLCFTDKYLNDLDDILNVVDLKALLSSSFCDGKYLYIPVNSYMFFDEGNSSFPLQLTEESNPIILKMKLK